MQGLNDADMMDWVSALTEEPSMAALLEPIVAHNSVRTAFLACLPFTRQMISSHELGYAEHCNRAGQRFQLCS